MRVIRYIGSILCRGIFRCNQVLANVPAIEMDEVQKNQLLAQASFCVLCGMFR